MFRTIRRAFLTSILFAAALASPVQAAVIKIATLAPEGSGWMTEMRRSAASIKTRTEGRVELKFYPAGVMGNDAAVLRKIKLGQLQGGAFSGAEASLVDKNGPIYGLPFLFRSQDEVDFVRGKVDALLFERFDKAGMTVAGFSGGGFAYLMSTKPIRTRDDLRRSKVWMPQNDKITEVAFKVGGVSPVALPLSDVYPGLQTGLIDTVANTSSGAIFFQWHTKVKYVVDLPLTYVVGFMLVDNKALAKLEEADRAALLDELRQSFDRIDRAARTDNDAARATLAKQGIEFIAPSAEETALWRDIGTQATKQLEAQGEYAPELLRAIEAALAEFRAKKAA
jgi:TRAP-type transport system periplasmic protein